MKLFNTFNMFNKKRLLLILFFSLTLIIFQLFLVQFVIGEYLFYTGKPNVVIDETTYEVDENFSVYTSEDGYAGIIGKDLNYPKLYVSHISDEYFIKLLEVKAIKHINGDKCQFFFLDYDPTWRNAETKLTFKWLDIENENVLEVYREFGCSIAKQIEGVDDT
ncbi:hypothetical protein AADZ86_13880 [Colwelliaceae bacterium BS250]